MVLFYSILLWKGYLDVIIYYVVVFIVSFIYMGFEIAAVRVLTPFFGNTMFTWGAIISAFLTGSMIGYWIGGKHADKPYANAMVIFYLMFGGLTVSAVPLASQILQLFNGLPFQLGVILGCMTLFLLPNIMLSAIVPAVTKEGLSLSFSGTQIGRFHTISAIGSITGTIFVTFWLLPALSLEVLFSLFAAGLVAALLLYVGKTNRRNTALLFPGLVVCVIPFIQNGDLQIHEPGMRLIAEKPSPYHTIYVVEHDRPDGTYRYMQFGPEVYQGAIKLDHPDEVLFKYIRHLLEIGESLIPDMERVFIVGHGIGTTSRLFEMKDKKVTTVEIDPVVLDISRQYFGYDGDSVVIGDGRRLLAQEPDGTIDYLILDAFSNESIPYHLTTNEFFSLTKKKLKEHGIMAMNVIGRIHGDEVLNSIYSTIANNFPFVRVYASDLNEKRVQNITIIASNTLIEHRKYSEYVEVRLDPGLIITDASTRFSRLN
jgi:spermidine synthase